MSSRYLIPKDRDVIDGVQLYLNYRGEQVEFQFPPTIENDSRRVNWTTDNIPGRDPLAVYESNSAREMTLKIEYIVENQSIREVSDRQINGRLTSIWSIGKIKKQINLLKGYFTGVRSAAGGEGSAAGGFVAGGSMSAQFWHSRITGTSAWSVRIGNVNTTYKGPQIGFGEDSHPLKTILNVDIATVSFGIPGDPEKYWDGLKPFPQFEDLWY